MVKPDVFHRAEGGILISAEGISVAALDDSLAVGGRAADASTSCETGIEPLFRPLGLA